MAFKNSMHCQRLSWCCNFVLTIICVILFAFNLYFSIALARPHMALHDYAKYTPSDIVHEYMTQITPASWVFVIWVIVYAMLIMWFIYILYLLIFRQACSRDNKLSLFPAFFWYLFIIVNLLNPLWLYLFVHDRLLVSGVVLLTLIIILILLNLVAFNACWYENINENDLDDESVGLLSHEIILLRLLTLNGLPLYAMWCMLLACIQWTMLFKYFTFNCSDNVASIITLAVLSALLVLYWSMELLFKRKYFVWTWFPSFALAVFCIGIVLKHNSIGGLNAPGVFFAFILFIVTCVTILLKSCGLCFCFPKSSNSRFSRVQ